MRKGVERVWQRMMRSLAEYRAAVGERDEAVRLQWEWLGDLAGKRVLEIGCGAGNILTMEIARQSGEYLGVDVQADRVAVLRRKLEAAGMRHARAEVQDVLDENWPWGRFDVIYAGSVLHAFGDIDKAASSLRGMLAEGGVLVAWEPMNSGWAVRLARALYGPFQPNRAWHHPLTARDVARWGAHFGLIGAQGFLGWSKWGYPLFVLPGGRRTGAWVGRKLRRLDAGRKGLEGWHQVVFALGGEAWLRRQLLG